MTRSNHKLFLVICTLGSSLAIYGGGCAIQGDSLYYIGGTSGAVTLMDTPNLNIYQLNFASTTKIDKSLGPWQTFGSKILPEQSSIYGTVVKTSRGQIAVIGGDSVNLANNLNILDTTTGKVSSKETQSQSPAINQNNSWISYSYSSVVSKDVQTVLHYGGSATLNGVEQFNTAVRVLDTKSLKWTTLPGTGPAVKNIISVFYGNKLLIIGGIDSKNNILPLTNISRYDIASGKWDYLTTSGNNPSVRINTNFIQQNSLLYLLGGTNQDDSPINDKSVYTLDLKSLVWSGNNIRRGFSPSYSGCLAYYKGVLISSFGTDDEGPGITSILYTKNWTQLDFKSLVASGKSINDYLDLSPPPKPTLFIAAIIGIVIASVALLVLIIILVICFIRKRRRRISQEIVPSLKPPELLQGPVWSPVVPYDVSQIYSLEDTHVPDFDTQVSRPSITPMSTIPNPVPTKKRVVRKKQSSDS